MAKYSERCQREKMKLIQESIERKFNILNKFKCRIPRISAILFYHSWQSLDQSTLPHLHLILTSTVLGYLRTCQSVFQRWNIMLPSGNLVTDGKLIFWKQKTMYFPCLLLKSCSSVFFETSSLPVTTSVTVHLKAAPICLSICLSPANSLSMSHEGSNAEIFRFLGGPWSVPKPNVRYNLPQ